jgi:hypothetical protein
MPRVVRCCPCSVLRRCQSCLLADPPADVFAVDGDAGRDVRQPAAWFVGGEVAEDRPVPLPERLQLTGEG